MLAMAMNARRTLLLKPFLEWRAVRIGLFLLVVAVPRAATAQPANQASDPAEVETVVVTGPMIASDDAPPKLILQEDDIRNYGAGSINELLQNIAPQTRSAGMSDGPLVIVNGRRVPNIGGLGDAPPEALQRVEILGEDAAPKYGQRAGQPVVNIVLRDEYAAITGEGEYAGATDGGSSSSRFKSSLLRIQGDKRWSLDAGYGHEWPLLESERGLPGEESSFRTLLPSSDDWNFGAAYTGMLSDGIEVTATGTFAGSELSTLLGLAGQGDLIRSATNIRTANLGLSANGDILTNWQWSVSAAFDETETSNRIGIDAMPSVLGANRLRVRTVGLEALLNGSVLELPAGPVGVSAKFDLDARQLYALADAHPSLRLDRERVAAQISFEVPIANRRRGILEPLGNLALRLSGGVEQLSDFGRLQTSGAGLVWRPLESLSLSGQVTHTETAPSLQQLGGPILRTPNIRSFDFVRNETVNVDLIQGGNPELRESREDVLQLATTFRPTEAVTLSTSFSNRRSTDRIASFPVVTPELERAFPERFQRGPDGRLIQIDQRPINIAGAETSELRSGVDVRLPWPGATGGQRSIDFSFYHTWRLRDRMTISPDMPVLDFLSGSVGETATVRPRHQLSLQAGAYHRGIGARASATWQNAARLIRPDGGDLTFSSLTVVNLRLFTDLGEVGTASWLQGARVTLEVNNLFNSRQRVRSAQGETPFVYDPAFLDPLGRELKLTLRKQF